MLSSETNLHLNPFKLSLGSGVKQAATQNAEKLRGARTSSHQHADQAVL